MTTDTFVGDAFAGFGLASPLIDGLGRAGFTQPTPIQTAAIAPQMAGRDLIGIAQTGTGKTAAFGLPMLNELLALGGRASPRTARALILAPTRELAVQTQEMLQVLAGGARFHMLLVLGGTSRTAQIRALSRGVDILVATPGRLTDLMDEGHVRFDETKIFVLDEADRMLDMGFVRQVQAIARRLHPRRRTALFSATMPAEVEGLAAGLLNDPVRVEVAPPGVPVAKIVQTIEAVEKGAKRRRLAEIVSAPETTRVLVFARTKHGADKVVENLERDGIVAAAIHGNKAQNARQRALRDFSEGRVRVLVATDIASRGIDVKDISHVVQYDMPDEPEAYVHRIGRTGRNGADGIAIALCASDEADKLRAIERLTRRRLMPAGMANLPQEAPEPARRGAGPGRSRGPSAPRFGKPPGKPAGAPSGRRPRRARAYAAA